MCYGLCIVVRPNGGAILLCMKTILITGCSSGFGLETARLFLERDWRVIATMRTPREDVLPRSPNLRVLPLDVTKQESIEAIVQSAGAVDVLVNNAGVGGVGVLEGTPMRTVRALFESNTFGAMALAQAFIPQMRERKSGAIVNVSSTVTYRALPLLSAYTASKAALNAFTECLAHELTPFGIRVSLVLPGQARETPFGQNARAAMAQQGVTVPEPYAGFMRETLERMMSAPSLQTKPLQVAEAVWQAVTEPLMPLRIPAGTDAVAIAGSVAR